MKIKELDITDIKPLRHEVLWQHKSSTDECVIDADFESTTFHIGVINNNEVVGTSTFIVDINNAFPAQNQYRLRAMATSPKVRGEGIGEQMIEEGIKRLKQMNVELLWCDARLKAIGFYKKMKFKVLGDIYHVPQIGPHQLMYIELN